MYQCRSVADKILKKDIASTQLSESDLSDYISACQLPFKNTNSSQFLSHKRNIINPDLYCVLATKKNAIPKNTINLSTISHFG